MRYVMEGFLAGGGRDGRERVISHIRESVRTECSSTHVYYPLSCEPPDTFFAGNVLLGE